MEQRLKKIASGSMLLLCLFGAPRLYADDAHRESTVVEKEPMEQAFTRTRFESAEEFVSYYDPNRVQGFQSKGVNYKIAQASLIPDVLFSSLASNLDHFFSLNPTAEQVRRILEIPWLFPIDSIHLGEGRVYMGYGQVSSAFLEESQESANPFIAVEEMKRNGTWDFVELTNDSLAKRENSIQELQEIIARRAVKSVCTAADMLTIVRYSAISRVEYEEAQRNIMRESLKAFFELNPTLDQIRSFIEGHVHEKDFRGLKLLLDTHMGQSQLDPKILDKLYIVSSFPSFFKPPFGLIPDNILYYFS